ncbi:MAG: VTT domain-containing protein [Methylorubrum populi]
MPKRFDLRRALAPAAILLVGLSGAAAGLLAPEAAASASRQVAAACDAAGPAGWALLVAIQVAVAASGILPASLFGVLAGALYGPGTGFGLAAAGTLLGAGLSFALGRAWAARRPRPGSNRLRQIDAMIVRDGWRAVCLLRLSPVMPFALTSWALSLSRVSPAAYGLGTLAALPSLLVYVVTGSLSRTGTADLARTGLFALGAVATLILAIRLRRSLAQRIGEPDAIVADPAA